MRRDQQISGKVLGRRRFKVLKMSRESMQGEGLRKRFFGRRTFKRNGSTEGRRVNKEFEREEVSEEAVSWEKI